MILVFPGQGTSLSIGMGAALHESFSKAREVFQEVDDTLGQNLSNLMFRGEFEELSLTENAQPALMAVSLAVARVLEKESGKKVSDLGVLVAGHSLGEYSALCAANVLSLAETARLLKIRGQAMQTAVPRGEGAMAALLGLELEVVQAVLEKTRKMTKSVVDLANDNCEGQLVISGYVAAVEYAVTLAQEAGAKKSVMLPVSAPFHSSLMMPAQERMAEALADVMFKGPSLPIIQNTTAQETQCAETLRSGLIAQVSNAVRWRESMNRARELGIEKGLELGAGRVLSNLGKRAGLEIQPVHTPEDIDTVLKTLI